MGEEAEHVTNPTRVNTTTRITTTTVDTEVDDNDAAEAVVVIIALNPTALWMTWWAVDVVVGAISNKDNKVDKDKAKELVKVLVLLFLLIHLWRNVKG
jgi:hypothetical protein